MKRFRIVCAALLLLAGAAVLLWPGLQGSRIEKAETEAVREFRALPKTAEKEERAFAALYEEMTAYNRRIFGERQRELKDPWSCEQSAFDLAAYGPDSDVIAVLDVPSCGIRMPVYLGASQENLLRGACVVGGTSMPVGGENTNCVIAGHRTWSAVVHFRSLEDVEIGDPVYLTNPWETLRYQVVSVEVIPPDSLDLVRIEPGRDLLSVFTCNYSATQRVLVTCERIKED